MPQGEEQSPTAPLALPQFPQPFESLLSPTFYPTVEEAKPLSPAQFLQLLVTEHCRDVVVAWLPSRQEFLLLFVAPGWPEYLCPYFTGNTTSTTEVTSQVSKDYARTIDYGQPHVLLVPSLVHADVTSCLHLMIFIDFYFIFFTHTTMQISCDDIHRFSTHTTTRTSCHDYAGLAQARPN